MRRTARARVPQARENGKGRGHRRLQEESKPHRPAHSILQVPYEAFGAGLADYKIVTTLCPGGKERMGRLIEMVRYGKLDLRPLLTHRFKLDQIKEAYNVFGNRMGGVMKVAITP